MDRGFLLPARSPYERSELCFGGNIVEDEKESEGASQHQDQDGRSASCRVVRWVATALTCTATQRPTTKIHAVYLAEWGLAERTLDQDTRSISCREGVEVRDGTERGLRALRATGQTLTPRATAPQHGC